MLKKKIGSWFPQAKLKCPSKWTHTSKLRQNMNPILQDTTAEHHDLVYLSNIFNLSIAEQKINAESTTNTKR
jgi:hypothetical protein